VDDEQRAWVYSALADLFAGAEAAVNSPPEGPWETYPLTRQAVALLARALGREPREDVAADHVRLFVNAAGGIPAPPYASWYLEGRLAGESTGRVAAAYAAQGLEIAEDGGQPADFVATELEFLHVLCRHQLAARATGDSAALSAAREAEGAFLLGHFCRWAPLFAKAVRDAAPGPVLAGAAEVLDALCAEEARRLGQALPRGSAQAPVGAMDRPAHSGRSDAGGR
jgi:TorA maturation chaperone TorD